MNIKEIKEKYRLYVHRKEWKELSETEKKMFEYLVEELNADTMVAPLLATEMYERIIEPKLTQQREEVVRNIRLDFIREFCNDHNGEIRWLRGISYDVNTLLDDILEYLQQQEKDKDE